MPRQHILHSSFVDYFSCRSCHGIFARCGNTPGNMSGRLSMLEALQLSRHYATFRSHGVSRVVTLRSSYLIWSVSSPPSRYRYTTLSPFPSLLVFSLPTNDLAVGHNQMSGPFSPSLSLFASTILSISFATVLLLLIVVKPFAHP